MAKAEKTRCGGEWTEARYATFIKGLLRAGMLRWGPKNKVKKKAEVGKRISKYSGRMSMHYRCDQCGESFPSRGRSEPGGKPVNLILVDHVAPVVDPEVGIRSWDEVIERMFIEEEGFQVLCKWDHDEKTKAERDLMYERKRREKNL